MFPYLAAALLSALWFLVHLLIGGRQIAMPLRASTALDPVVRDTQYLCWHFTSCGIAAMALLFAWAAASGEQAFALAATGLAAGFTLTGIALVTRIGQSHAALPQGWLFLPVTALGLWGIAA